jgi:diguanylate cyclase (GGDEF)-like protein
MRADSAHNTPTVRPWRATVLAALAIALVLATAGLAQLLLAQRASSGGSVEPAPGEHSADARALLTAYDENLLDPAPAIADVLNGIAARPGVAEVALVSGEGVEMIGGKPVAGASLVADSAAPSELAPTLDRVLRPNAKPLVEDDVVVQPLAIHDDPHALVVVREAAPTVVALAELRSIVAGTLLAAAVALAVGLIVRRRALAAQHRAAVLNAGLDLLTGLGGHRRFREELSRQAGIAVRRGRPVSLAIFDVDRFAEVNATQGMLHGDTVLTQIGTILASGRTEDIAFRSGDDEFALLMPHTNAAGAMIAVERIRASIAGRVLGVTVSAGLAELDPAMPSAGSLLAQAELALHDAKQQGRDRLVIFDPFGARAAR